MGAGPVSSPDIHDFQLTEFSVRTYNALMNAGIKAFPVLEFLYQCDAVCGIAGLGERGVNEVNRFVSRVR